MWRVLPSVLDIIFAGLLVVICPYSRAMVPPRPKVPRDCLNPYLLP
ncbi:hypothetical protein HRbin03_00441 [archaeon HR03]|nr:hypothetical protein HRbin03_00441 [archaeon HR03]